MCGISGIVANRPAGVLKDSVERMTGKLRHRGPDAGGIFQEDGVALGHRRLAIIDLSSDANQPMRDASGRYILVFNGELYNFRDIKLMLPEYNFRTNSDSEVILAAYGKWGTRCLDYFNGMYGLAIWDRQEKSLFLTRGRLGVKPLYFRHDGDSLTFASELRAVLAGMDQAPRLNKNGVLNYMMYQSACAPETPVEGVQQLMPGEYAVFKGGKLEQHLYWNIEDARHIEPDRQAIHKTVRQLLTESVQRRMISDVPLGAFLSGGIDSSAVVGLMAECTAQPVHTFSITFREPDFDESRYSALIARRFNTRHTPILLQAGDFLNSFPDALRAMDNPSGDGFNTFLISRVTKEAGITVALSGIGGDELFAGYSSFKRWLALRKHWIWRIPTALRSTAGLVLLAGNSSKFERIAGLTAAPTPGIEYIYPAIRQVLTLHRAKKILRCQDECHDMMYELLAARKKGFSKLPVLSQYTAAEMLGYTFNVLLKDTDQMSMASALEVREPFFDYRLIEYVLGIPDEIKYPLYPKSLLVESLSPLLPDEIVHRPKKGFTLPWNQWLRTELRQWCQEKLTGLAQRPEFNGDEIGNIADRYFNHAGNNNWMPVLQMAVLEDWIERNLP
jgi:asparagine synthase (glutamine-hydrolysing)